MNLFSQITKIFVKIFKTEWWKLGWMCGSKSGAFDDGDSGRYCDHRWCYCQKMPMQTFSRLLIDYRSSSIFSTYWSRMNISIDIFDLQKNYSNCRFQNTNAQIFRTIFQIQSKILVKFSLLIFSTPASYACFAVLAPCSLRIKIKKK